jgi:hypothetical protein
VAINYLNLPGFTDTPEESDSLMSLLAGNEVDMIQWRNMNFDPLRYWRIMNQAACSGAPLGMKHLLGAVKREFPKVKNGYFNPPKESF